MAWELGLIVRGLYIHIPFCERQCSYCSFYKVSSHQWNQVQSFFQVLEKELDHLPAEFSPDTIFIGGGTPTAPDLPTLERFFPLLKKFNPSEFTVEVNPGTVDQSKFALLKQSGVNRLSIGMQSFNDECLKILGRIHSSSDAKVAFNRAREVGFENISVDLMFGIPGQTLEMLNSDLDQALALGSEHISIYNLMYEKGTLIEKCSDRLDENLERDMFDLIRRRLASAGFEHYEISNFAKPGHACAHNMLYWTGAEYLGCGPSAHSHWNGTRWGYVADLDDYCATGPRREFEETLDSDAKARETLVMGLRLVQGLDLNPDLFEKNKVNFEMLEEQGLLIVTGHHVRLSEDALFVSDAVFSELV